MSDRILCFKRGVSLAGLQPEALIGVDKCLDVFHSNGLKMTLTSGRDGKHGKHSHHHKGLAWDIRIWDIRELIDEYVLAIQAELGEKYQVFNESDHIHCEFDPA